MAHKDSYPNTANLAPLPPNFDGGLPNAYLKVVWGELTGTATPRYLKHSEHAFVDTKVSLIDNDRKRQTKQFEAAEKGGNVQDLTAVVRAGGSLFTVLNVSTYPGNDRMPTTRRAVAVVDPMGGHARFLGFIGENADNVDGRVRVGKNHAYGKNFGGYMSREQFVVGFDEADSTRTSLVVLDGNEERYSANGCALVSGSEMNPYVPGGFVNGEHGWWDIDEAELQHEVEAQQRTDAAQLAPVG